MSGLFLLTFLSSFLIFVHPFSSSSFSIINPWESLHCCLCVNRAKAIWINHIKPKHVFWFAAAKNPENIILLCDFKKGHCEANKWLATVLGDPRERGVWERDSVYVWEKQTAHSSAEGQVERHGRGKKALQDPALSEALFPATSLSYQVPRDAGFSLSPEFSSTLWELFCSKDSGIVGTMPMGCRPRQWRWPGVRSGSWGSQAKFLCMIGCGLKGCSGPVAKGHLSWISRGKWWMNQSRSYELIGRAGSVNSGEILQALVEETLRGKGPGRDECHVHKAAITTLKEMSSLMEVLPVLGVCFCFCFCFQASPPPPSLMDREKKSHSREWQCCKELAGLFKDILEYWLGNKYLYSNTPINKEAVFQHV